MRSTFQTFCSDKPPVVVAHDPQVDDGVGRDAAGEVDVRIDVTEGERARRREDRFPAVQSGIARARDRAPPAVALVDEDHVIELVDRLEAQDERRITVLFEDHGRRESAASRQCAGPWRTTPRKLRSVAPPGGGSLL